MSITNINSTNAIYNLSQELASLEKNLNANLLDEIDRIALIPRLENMLAKIEAETSQLKTRLQILKDDTHLESDLLSLKKIKDVWQGVYHNCIRAQLFSLTQICNKTEIALSTDQQTSQKTTKDQHQALKKIEQELKQLNDNPQLNEEEKRSVETCLSQVKKLLPLIEQQMENDLIQALSDPSAANKGQFISCSDEILLNLLSFLSPEDLTRLSSCSTFFRNICEDESIWKGILSQEFPSISIANKSAKEIYSSQKIEQSLINSLKNGLYICSTLVKLDEVTCLRKYDNLIFYGCKDKTIRVWDLTTNQCMTTLERQQCVDYLCKEGNLLFLGLRNGIIQVWNLTTNRCMVELSGHKSFIRCLYKEGNQLFSGSWDDSIKVWDLTTNQCILTLTKCECSIVKEGDLLFSSYRASIKIWDLSTSQCINDLREHDSNVSCLDKKDNRLFSGFADGVIKVWDLSNSSNIRCIATLVGHEHAIRCFHKAGNLLFSGSWDGVIKVWDLTTTQCLATLAGHHYPVIFLYKEGNRLFSGDKDGTIKIWDF